MPRRSRFYRPGIPAHVVQRGHNRERCFFSDENYCHYKNALWEALRRYGGNLHAYCLMTNHVHLLVTPEEEDSISRIMQHTGREYVQYINRVYQRSGTIWEGRHKGSLVEADAYLLTCYRYIERNPVAAYMVESPEEYLWSSYHHNALGVNDPLITEHTLYKQLGASPVETRTSYREFFRVAPKAAEIVELRECLAANKALGSEKFRKKIGEIFGRDAGRVGRGRPRKIDCN